MRKRGKRRFQLPPGTDIVAYLLSLNHEERAQAIAMLSKDERESLDVDWASWAHRGQLAPAKCPDGSDWRTWVIMAGRGFGKTLAGAQWVTMAVSEDQAIRIALIGATLDDARRVMVEGQSGLLAVAAPWIAEWRPSLRRLRFTSGAEATLFSGASPEALRGPEHHLAWCDELAKWEKGAECWDMLQLGLRLGTRPRALVTTTPRPGPVLRRIMASPGAIVTGGPTGRNPHLPGAFKQAVEELYGGTRLGRQELDGELLTDSPGALWTVEGLERCRTLAPSGAGSTRRRRAGAGEFDLADSPAPSSLRASSPPPRGRGWRTVIGVDPPSGDGTCGIIACARDSQGIGHVLADHSVTARSPEGWARAVADAAALHLADLVVAERNQGGKMVEAVLRIAGPRLRLKLVTASQGKSARAEPVALLFEAGRVRLHGCFPELEAELLGLIAGGGYDGPGVSPDRADALVWALTELMLGKQRSEPRVIGL